MASPKADLSAAKLPADPRDADDHASPAVELVHGFLQEVSLFSTVSGSAFWRHGPRATTAGSQMSPGRGGEECLHETLVAAGSVGNVTMILVCLRSGSGPSTSGARGRSSCAPSVKLTTGWIDSPSLSWRCPIDALLLLEVVPLSSRGRPLVESGAAGPRDRLDGSGYVAGLPRTTAAAPRASSTSSRRVSATPRPAPRVTQKRIVRRLVVELMVQLDIKQAQAGRQFSAEPRRVLRDATGEHQRIQALQRRRRSGGLPAQPVSRSAPR